MTRRTPSQYDWSALEFDETILTKHRTSPRRSKIAFVVAHHMTVIGRGDGAANDTCWNIWQNRQASAHYGIDGGYVRQFVWDRDAAWATGNTTGNHAGISIEHANASREPGWAISDTTWKTGARLAAQLHVAYKLGRPTSTSGGRGGTLRKHSSFTSTACPGPYFDKIWPQYVAEAQRAYDVATGATPTPPPVVVPPKPTGTYAVTKGDTLSSIARRAGITVEDLITWNAIAQPNQLAVGRILRLAKPAATTPPTPVTNSSSMLLVNCASKRTDVGLGSWAKRRPVLAQQILDSDASFIVCSELYSDQRASLQQSIAEKYKLAGYREGRVLFHRTGRWTTPAGSWWRNLRAGRKPSVVDKFTHVETGAKLTLFGLHLTWETDKVGAARRVAEVKAVIDWARKSHSGHGRRIYAGDVNSPAGSTTRTDDVGPVFKAHGYHDLGLEAGAQVGKGRYHLDRGFGGDGVEGTRVVVKPTVGSDHPLTYIEFTF